MQELGPSTARRRRDRVEAGQVRNARLRVVGGLAFMLVGTPAMVLVAVTTRADWAYLATLAVFVVGLFAVGGVIASERSAFRSGTKIWQNDGLPGGGAGGAC